MGKESSALPLVSLKGHCWVPFCGTNSTIKSSPKIPNADFVCYADDLAVIVSGKDQKALVASASYAMTRVLNRLANIGLRQPHIKP